MMKLILQILSDRYVEMTSFTKSGDRVKTMMSIMIDNVDIWPPDKIGRWLGYVQCLVIEVDQVSTIDEERDFTRPMFHRYYKEIGQDIPESVEINVVEY